MTVSARTAAAVLVTLSLATPAVVATPTVNTPVVLDGDGWTITLNGLPSGWSGSTGTPGRLMFDATPNLAGPDPWAAALQFGPGRSTSTLGWIGFTIQADPGYVLQSWTLSASGLWGAPSRHQVAHSHLIVKPDGPGGDKVHVPYTFADGVGHLGGTWSVTSGPYALGGETFGSYFKFVNTVKGPLGVLSGGLYGGPQFAVHVAPVPEPDEWAMMLAGLGLVGWAARRRRTAGATMQQAAAA